MAGNGGIQQRGPEDSNDMPTSSRPNVNQQFGTYKVDPERGTVLIINNTKFLPFVDRASCAADTKMYGLFNGLNFEKVRSETNLSCGKIRDILGDESKKMSGDVSCFVCVILSYGGDGYIYGTDGVYDKMEIEQVMAYFKGDKCKPLIDKPKLFFVETCPSKLREHHDGPTLEPEPAEIRHRIPEEADQLLVQSCIPDSLAFDGDKENRQSWFIDALRDAISSARFNRGPRSDLLSMLTQMNRKIANKIHAAHSTEIRVEVPYTSSTLRKEMFF